MHKYKRKGRFINVMLFLLMIFAGGTLFFVFPKEMLSERENRYLTKFPTFTYASLWNGTYTDSLEMYYSDNFIFRNELINFAGAMRECAGYRNEEIRFYSGPDFETGGQNVQVDSKVILQDSIVSDTTLLIKDSLITSNADPEGYSKINSVIVYKKRAIQMFKGSNAAMKRYANLMKRYQEELGPGINIYCLAIPVGADFYLPEKFSHSNEKDAINWLYGYLPPGVKGVRAYDVLERHKNEYIHFNTDHHWTGRGAFYAYGAFCEAAGITPIPMEGFTRKVIRNFLGTMYSHTLSSDLKENVDSVEYFKIPYDTKSLCYPKGNVKGRSTQLYIEGARGGHAYGVFLGADYPLMKITTPNKNSRKILEIKDSYGNAFAPFLAAHFEEVFVVDYRYFEGSIKELIAKNGITDIIFAHNVYVVNSGYTIQRELQILK